jgi:tetratricopeptide (TPR) repeat protein/transglutaminase-like putative cysteine protease
MKILSFTFFLLISLTAFAQSSLQPGYDLMAEGKAKEAKAFFTPQLKGAAAADAAIALSFVEAMLENGRGSIEMFTRFYELEQDPLRRHAFVDALWGIGGSELLPAQMTLLDGLLETDYTRLRPLALYAYGEHYDLTNDVEKSRASYAKLGMTDQWQIVGNFENISESGFDRDFGVLAKPGPDATFTNKLGVKVGWFPVRYLSVNRWLNFGNHLATQNSVLYAQTFCQSPADREVTMRLGTSGSVKVWLNDVLVFSEAEERDNHLDTYRFRAPLKAGNNRILVQVGASDKTGANFMLRLTDEAGKVLEDLKYSTTYATYPRGADREPVVLENPTENYFRELAESGKASIVERSAYAGFYLRNGFYPEALEVLTESTTLYPGSARLLNQLATVLDKLDNDTDASAIREYVAQNMPESPSGFLRRFGEAETTKNWTEYAQLLKRYKEVYGESTFTLLKDITLAAQRQEVEGMIGLIEKGYAQYPENTEFVTGQSKVISEIRKDPQGAIKFLNKYAKKHYRTGVVEELIDLYYNAGETEKTEDLIVGQLARDPLGGNYYPRLASLYQARGNLKKSITMLEEALKLSPYNNGLYQTMGGILADGKEKEKAEAAYRRAIELNPYDYESRDALRNLTTGEATAFSVFPEKDYYAIYAAAPGAETYPDDNSLILNYDVEQVVYDGGSSESRTTVLIKPLNAAGVDTWKEYTISIYGNQQGVVETVEVLDPDGSRHEASRNGADIVFDNLQVGGAIYLSYRIKDFKYGRLSGKFWNAHPLNLSFPILQSSFSLLVPEGTKFSTEITGPELETMTSEKTTLDGRELYLWESKMAPGLQPESTMPAFDDVLTSVRVTNIEDWTFIANWYSELTYAKIRPDNYVREKVAELFAGKEGLTERAEVELIYDYVVKEIRYISVPFLQSNHIPQRASKTITTGQGDCKDVSSLFVAMCDVRGIDANLVLVSTRDQARADLSLPGIGFNHCIAKIDLEDKEYFVELTDENLPFGTGDWSVNNSFAVVIPREGEAFSGQAGLINPATRGVNAIYRQGKVTFEGEDMLLDFENRRENAVVSNLRHNYEEDSPTNREKTMLESLAGRYPRLTLSNLKFDESLTDLSPALTYEYGYRVEDAGTKIGGMYIYDIRLSDRIENPAWISTESRKLPIDLWQLFDAELYEQTVMIEAPAGKKAVETPAGLKVDNENLSYEIRYTPKGDGIEIYRYFKLKRDLVEPEDYKAFREDVLKIVEADEITLAFR